MTKRELELNRIRIEADKQSQAQDKLFAPSPPAIKPVQELLY